MNQRVTGGGDLHICSSGGTVEGCSGANGDLATVIPTLGLA